MRAFALSILLLSASALAASKPATRAKPRRPHAEKQAPIPEKTRSVEGISEYSLPNGLHILLFPDDSKPSLTINLTYRVGSRHEGYGETGMAHLLEHMLFKGTPQRKDIPALMKQLGASFNASTSFDRTNYFETLTANDDNLRAALALEADRMINSSIDKTELDREMTVVRNEYEAGENEPSNILQERVLSSAYLWHNYGHSTIGARSDIDGVPVENLRAFYRKYYQPDNAVLLIAGKFDAAKALAWTAQLFGAIPKPARVLPLTHTTEPVQDGERSVTLRRVGEVQSLAAAYHIPAGFHPDNAPINVLIAILADTPGGRLHKALVEKKLATQVSGYSHDGAEAGYLMFGADIRREDSLPAAKAEFLRVLDDAATHPPTAEEVQRAKAGLVKQNEMMMQNSSRIGFVLSEYIAQGDWRLFLLQRDRIEAVTEADVGRVAKAYLKPSNRTLGEFIPDAQPDRADIPAAEATDAQLANFKGRAAMAQGESFDPTPANLEARIVRRVLPGGTRTALLTKKTRGNTVNLVLRLPFGDEKTLQGRAVAGGLAGSMLLRGSTKHTRQQLKDEFDRLKAQVNVDGDAKGAFVTIEATRENLAPALRLAVETLREPAFSAEEFAQLRAEALAGAEQEKSDPQALAGNRLSRRLNDWPAADPRYVMTAEENIAALKGVTLEQVRAFHHDFYGADHALLSAVGDFDGDALAKLAGELLGGWKSAAPYVRLADPYRAVKAGEELIETPDKANAIFLAGLPLQMQDTAPDFPALVMANYMLGGGSLSNRIADRLRRKDGFSYGAGSGLNASSWEPSSTWNAYAIYAPQNRAKLAAAFREEIDRAIKEGFTGAELKDARDGWLKNRMVRRGNDNSLASRMADDLPLSRSFAWDAQIEEKVGAVTLDQANAALRQWIDPAQLVSIYAGDFAGAEKKK